MRRLSVGTIQVASVLLAISFLGGGCVKRPDRQVSPGELLTIGQEDLRSERYEAARAAFKRLLREYPDSQHRRQALLNLADSYYKSEDYLEARVQYSEFVQLYPVSPYTAKAYYFLGMSDFHRVRDFDQEQVTTRDGIKSFEELLKRFPNSTYASQGKEKLTLMKGLLAKHELFIGRFYVKRGQRVSAIPRLKEVIEKYKEFPDLRAEAFYLLGESYRIEQAYEEAARAYRNLIQEHPESPYAQTAYNQLLALKKQEATTQSVSFPSLWGNFFSGLGNLFR